MKNFTLKVLAIFILLLFQGIYAQSPNLISYQAIVRGAGNALAANKSIGVKVSILQTSASGTVVYQESFTPNPTTNANGLLTLQIGSGTPITGTLAGINWNTGPYFVKTEIDPNGGTAYSLISTSQLLSVPYALSAKTAQSVAGITGTNNKVPKFISANSLGDSQISDNGTSVGINVGTLDPNIRFQVQSTTGDNSFRSTLVGVPATSIATAGSIYGESTTGIGVIGVSSSQNGIYGLSTGTLGGTVGVNTGTGKGIWGVTTGAGVAGFFDGGTSGKGLIVSNGATGIGTENPTGRLTVMQPSTPVAGIDNYPAISGYSYTAAASLKGGVYGYYNTANYGTGIHGIGYNGVEFTDANSNFGTGNQDVGVFGSANTAGVEGVSTAGIGVVGYNKNSSFAATTGGGNTYGVFGYANTIGGATVPNTRYGVYGFATGAATNYAGYFSGNVQVTGSLAKGSGTFKIDHPLDPENKYLYHSFVESPDMMNVYNGNITTDSNGTASVKMPEYFSALNKDFRYQLTVIGTFAQAIISQEIKENTFVIKTDKPNIKVSWQVTGVRQDKFANAHRVIPEVEKEQEMKGKYLHAKEWGKPESQSIDFKSRPLDKMPETGMKGRTSEGNVKAVQNEKTEKGEVAGVTIKN